MINIDISFYPEENRIYVHTLLYLKGVVIKALILENGIYKEVQRWGWDFADGRYFFSHPSLKENTDFKVEIWDNFETTILKEATFKGSKTTSHDKILVISPIKNEIDILPFFLDYYLNFLKVDKIIFVDGGSDDGSVGLINSYGNKTEVINRDHGQYNEYLLMAERNTLWKSYKHDYDWIIVCDADEFLYHPNFRELLKNYSNLGITIPNIKGYDMMSQEFPIFQPSRYITEIITKGIRHEGLDKKIVFNPKKVNMAYSFGSHYCFPEGEVIYNTKSDIILLHYKNLSYEYLLKKSRYGNNRRSEIAIAHKQANHWNENLKITLEEYNKRFEQTLEVFPTTP
jgi:hypothetical protein